MRTFSRIIIVSLGLWSCCTQAVQIVVNEASSQVEDAIPQGRNVSTRLFAELEELSRIVDISYCVGVTGIRQPFECAGRCAEFPGWELVDVSSAGVLAFC